METAIITVVCVGIILIATLTMMMHSFNAATTLSESMKEMEEQAANIRRTEIASSPCGNYTGGDICLMVNNEGQTKLAQFPKWDVIAQYQDISKYIGYTTDNPPGNDRWTVDGIYLPDNSPEVLDHDILNPGEKMKVIVDLDPEIVDAGRITISTPNGVTSECIIIRNP
jgi:hypothetical protein